MTLAKHPSEVSAMRQALGWAGGAIAFGAWLWPWWPCPVEPMAWVAVALGVAALLARGRTFGAPLWVLGAVLLGGLACATQRPAAPVTAERPVQGVVLRSSGGDALIGTAEGRYWLSFGDDAPDVGVVVAALVRPPGAVVHLPGDVETWVGLARSGATAARVRSWVRLGTPSPPRPIHEGLRHGPLLEALVTGQKDAVPEAELTLLRRTGTAHLLSVSGMNVALVAGFCAGLTALVCRPLTLLRWPWAARFPPMIVAICVAIAYADLAGWPVSTRRAVWMTGAAIIARALGRPVRVWNLLGLAAALIVLEDPGQVGEVAFQLSFGAVIGMVLVAPRLTRLVPPDSPRALVWLVGSLGATLGATAGTLPVSALRFQEVSPSSPVANLLAGPLLGGVAMSGAMLGDLLPGGLGRLCLLVADWAAGAGLLVLSWFDVDLWHPAVSMAGALVLLVALLFRRRPALVLAAAAIALGMRQWPRLPTATFLAIGQGDAAVMRWPDGRVWLVDGGPPGPRLLRWLRREGIYRIDTIFLSHADADHLGGLLPVVDGLDIGAVYAPQRPRPDEGMFLEFADTLTRRGIPFLGPDATPPPGAEILHPTPEWLAGPHSDNDASLIVRVTAGDHTILFAGDIEAEGEKLLAPTLLPVEIVKVPHHGSRSSSTQALIEATHPTLAVISCGVGNAFGHPSTEVLDRWSNSQVLRTDQQGTITLTLGPGAPVTTLEH